MNYYVPEDTEKCGYYECRECGSRFLDLRTEEKIVCPCCSEDPDTEIGPDEEMPAEEKTAVLLQVVTGKEEVSRMDALLSLAVTGGDFSWI